MVSPVPATIYNTLLERLREILVDISVYRSESDLAVRKLQADANKLIKVDAASGYTILASVSQLTGDVDGLRYNAENASKLRFDCAWQSVLAVGLQNLGYFSDSQREIVIVSDPRYGQFSGSYSTALNAGAIQTTWRRYLSLPSMGIEMPHDFPEDIIRDAAVTLHNAGISDEAVAYALDAAGSVLRRHNSFFAGGGPVISVTKLGGQPIVHFRFGLALTPSEVADANAELALLMAQDSTSVYDSVHVSFGTVA